MALKLKIFNFALFQLGWFACALGAGRQMPNASALAVAVLLVVHFTLSTDRKRDLQFIFLVGLLGAALDSTQGWFGIMSFNGQWNAPLWLIGLWMLFASTVYYSLNWLHGRYVLLAILGGVGGAMSYYAGYRFDALQLADNLLYSVVIIGIAWAITTPAIFWLSTRIFRRFDNCI